MALNYFNTIRRSVGCMRVLYNVLFTTSFCKNVSKVEIYNISDCFVRVYKVTHYLPNSIWEQLIDVIGRNSNTQENPRNVNANRNFIFRINLTTKILHFPTAQ